ncbi:MAG TPA: hypothetical protein PLW39_13135 [Thermoflexales bacterium]|nr:hypothetical protein [Thermoflexales bacterium]HQW33979.1 hypothetical protein [Thermoflexales bacterium]HQX75115.1 hypothetical protein [Thermoflexales bacterium]HQZ23205.1 hypothetical protein [Thermoflexales bacterium]
MKTTLEIPDSLYRQLKMQAAKDGVRMSDVLAEGIQLAVAARQRKQVATPAASFPLIKAKHGTRAFDPQSEAAALAQEDAANGMAG